MSGVHKVLSPSSASRRRLCGGALAACKGVPNKNSPYAAEGTAYHLVASTTLETMAADMDGSADALGAGGMRCEDYVGRWVNVYPGDREPEWGDKKDPKAEFSFKIDEENAAYAQVYVDAMLRRQLYSSNVDQMYEVKLDTSTLIGIPGQGGTGDCLTLDFNTWTIYSDDLKFGKGKQVFASYEVAPGVRKPNDQAAWYGAAALRMFRSLGPWKKVVIGIHQPRIRHVDEFELSVEDLDAWVAEMAPLEREAYRLWESGTEAEILAALAPSDEACTFCPIKMTCVKRLNAAVESWPVIVQQDGPNTARRELWASTDAEFLRALNIAEEYSSFFNEVYAEALRRIQAGSNLPGWKTVIGNKGRRKLDPEKEVAAGVTAKEYLDAKIGEDAYEPAELKTAAELDKLLNKKRHPDAEIRKMVWETLQKCISQADGQPELVRAGDARPSAGPVPMVEFQPVPGQ